MKRLLVTCKTVSHKLPSLFEFGSSGNPRSNPAAFLVLSPKETELVLDVIDEFVFFTKPSKTKKITTQLQELQLLQIIVEFYQEKLSDVPDSLELNESTGNNFDLKSLFAHFFTHEISMIMFLVIFF